MSPHDTCTHLPLRRLHFSGQFQLPSCRDRGKGGVDVGALCLSSSGCDPFASPLLIIVWLPVTGKRSGCDSIVCRCILVEVERSWEENERAGLRQSPLTAGGFYGYFNAYSNG